MSGFDEEAERERLREKYEQDQEKRAATQRMSELLLKGATMTNSHCDACGDPLFRYDGQTFCPTCQAAEREAAAAGEGEADADAEAGAEDVPTEAGADADADADADAAPANETAETSAASAATTPDRRTRPSAGGESPAVAGDGRREPATEQRPRSSNEAPRPATGTSGEADAPLADAHASLSRTLVRYARAAEDTDDPRRAKELLAAAREAAEALAALDRR